MELFWTLFWLAVLIIPALYLAQIVFGLVMTVIVLTVGGIINLAEWLFNKVREK